MKVLAIDPGTHPGFALFSEGRLVACDTTGACADIVDSLVIERPMVYPHSAVPPNDVVSLAITAGRLAERYIPITCAVPQWVFPRQWKGQVPKPKSRKWKDYVVHKRILAVLDESERRTYETALAAVFATNCDLTDAVGLGLWSIERYP